MLFRSNNLLKIRFYISSAGIKKDITYNLTTMEGISKLFTLLVRCFLKEGLIMLDIFIWKLKAKISLKYEILHSEFRKKFLHQLQRRYAALLKVEVRIRGTF